MGSVKGLFVGALSAIKEVVKDVPKPLLAAAAILPGGLVVLGGYVAVKKLHDKVSKK